MLLNKNIKHRGKTQTFLDLEMSKDNLLSRHSWKYLVKC